MGFIHLPRNIYNSIAEWRDYSGLGLLYFTNWFLVLVVLHAFVYKYVNLVFLACSIFFMSTFIVHVYPRRIEGYKNNGEKFVFQGKILIIFDILLHVLPVAFVLIKYLEFYKIRPWGLATSNALLIILIYVILINPVQIYGLNAEIACSLVIAGMLGYWLLIRTL